MSMPGLAASNSAISSSQSAFQAVFWCDQNLTVVVSAEAVATHTPSVITAASSRARALFMGCTSSFDYISGSSPLID